jgi:3-hydroxyisobutyrate dehydrogenase-like beta-hydroxyacid dehydrogenase
MGNSMSKNLLKNNKWKLFVKDFDNEKEKELKKSGAIIASNIEEIFLKCDLIITCLPGGEYVNKLFFDNEKAINHVKPNQYIIDMSTSQPDLMVKLNDSIKIKKAFFADAPIARTRQAAVDGTLAIMVGCELNVFNNIHSILKYMGNDIMHCGKVGSGQLTKILNNMILFETVVALSEAASISKKYGMKVNTLFENITKCSGDSFALRNHGLKSIAKDYYPSPAFSTEYALKDLSYALELGEKLNVSLPGASTVEKLFQKSIKNGDKDLYFPVIRRNLS